MRSFRAIHASDGVNQAGARISVVRRLLRACAWGCGSLLMLSAGLLVLLYFLLNRVPEDYPLTASPIPAPQWEEYAASGLDGFESPYLGHTGSWDGKGGRLWGGPKAEDMDLEVEMGLRWTFLPVYWSAMEPDGPVLLEQGLPPAWRALDAFLIEAQKRRLNVLMQAPVVGGNAGGPPAWAGLREKGKSAPLNMEALAQFAGKLARRYCPGGRLAMEQGWGSRYGVRAWELDNEPEMYRTHWKDQAGDYAEFATLAAAAIKSIDPKAWIVAPALASGREGLAWLESALNPAAMAGSDAFRDRGMLFSVGPVADVVSLHNYEGLDSAFSSGGRTIAQVLDDVRSVFERGEQRASGFHYARKQEYWHTEGNYDFIGALGAERRAAWRVQFMTRAFAAGLRKICVMDASERERLAVGAYVRTLPWPFPMRPADSEVKMLRGRASVFCHLNNSTPDSDRVWILWAVAAAGDAQLRVPIRNRQVKLVHLNGMESMVDAPSHQLDVELKGDSKMAPPVLIVDRKS